MNALESVDVAVAVAKARLSSAPQFPLYQSIDAQLQYLRSVLTGEESDRSRLKQLNFGVYAAKEFESSDPEFAEVLFRAFFVAAQMAKGLKVGDVPA